MVTQKRDWRHVFDDWKRAPSLGPARGALRFVLEIAWDPVQWTGAGIAVNGIGPRHLEGSNTNMSVWDIYIIVYIDGLDIELTCWNLKSCWN